MNNDSCTKYIKENFIPTGIVFSTVKAKEIIGKNNLKPAEFLRPFGVFPRVDFHLGTFNKSISNFRLDCYDCEDFFHPTPSSYPSIIESVLSDPKILPELPTYNLKDRKLNYKIPDNIMNKLKYFSFPWFNEYANTIVELNRFNEYELYQQPLCIIYFCSIDDPIKSVKPQMNEKEKIPPLLYEKIYDSDMPVVIIILDDKSPDAPLISEAQKTSYIESFRHEFKNNYLLYWELNDINAENPQAANDASLNPYKDDIWTKYAHKTELKSINNSKVTPGQNSTTNTKNNIKGRYLNLTTRKRFHQMLYDFFNKYAVKELEKKLTYIDRYITENKKGLKNAIFGFLKTETPNQSRWNNNFRMYVLSNTEFQEYLIAMVYFYFQNYDQAKEICNIFMEDIKKKSIKHYNAAFELQKMSSFMASPSGKETSFEPFDQHVNNKDYLQACRALFFGIKASEQKSNILKLPTILTKACRLLSYMSAGNYNNEIQNLSSIVPFIYEQTAIYYLFMNPMKKRKFFSTIMQAGAKYYQEGKIANMGRFAFYDFLFLKEFLDSNEDDSYMITKEYVTNSLGNLSQRMYFYPGSLVFYQRFLESTVFYSNAENGKRENIIMDNLNKLFRAVVGMEDGKKKGLFLGDYNISDISIPIVDNTSVLVIEEQDYLISRSDNMNFFANPANWSYFKKYDYVPVKKIFLCLTPPDIMALKNLDNIVLNKQNFSNFFSKRKFHINVKGKIFVRFVISNPLPFDLNLTDIKLIVEFVNDRKDSSTNLVEKTSNEQNPENSGSTPSGGDPLESAKRLDFELESKNIKLAKFSTQKIELFVQVYKEGKINIKGVEFVLGNCAQVKHYFNKKNKVNLYKYTKKRRQSISTTSTTSKRRMSVSSQSSASSKGSSRNSYQPHINYKEEIICDIVDNNNDINIVFPMGKEITLYKDQFYLMPIKIINNSDIKIKRFCFYFNDGIHNYKNTNKNIKIIKDDLSGNCFLNELIYKEIEVDNDKTAGKNEQTIYVPLLPRKRAEIFLKILFKFEEDKTYIDNEVQRFIIRIKIKDSFNFVLNERINQFLPSLTQFQLNSICTIKNNSFLENFTLGKIYFNESFKIDENNQNSNSNEWQKTENKDYVVLYNKFIFDKKIDDVDYEDNFDIKNNLDNDYIIKKRQQKLNKKIEELENKINFEENNVDNIMENPQQNHIKKKLCYLLAKNNIIFSWLAKEKKTNNEIKGLYIHKTDLKIPTINVQFLTQLLNSSVSFNHYVNKLDENNTICTLEMMINKNIFKEMNDIKSFDVYVNKFSDKYNWIGLKKYTFQNNNFDTEKEQEKENNNMIKLEFNCLFREKGEYDFNQVSMTIESNIAMQKTKYINKILSPIMVKIE